MCNFNTHMLNILLTQILYYAISSLARQKFNINFIDRFVFLNTFSFAEYVILSERIIRQYNASLAQFTN